MNETIKAMHASLNGNRGAIMVGGSYSYSGETLYFRFKARAANNANCLKIDYNAGLDLFNLSFMRITTKEIKEIKSINEIYVDQVQEIFERETRLYLSL